MKNREMEKHKKNIIVISLISTVLFYYLAGIWLNPFIIWTALPLYISYSLMTSAVNSQTMPKVIASYGFALVSIASSILYHLTWYFDWQGTQTSSSTSSLIFVFFPIYAVVLGFIGYGLGLIAGFLLDKK